MTPAASRLFLALMVLAFVLRLVAFQGPRSLTLGMDGGLSVALASLEVKELLHFSAQDTHPPLHYLLLHYWLKLAGSSPFAAKYLSLFFSVVSVALMYSIGKRASSQGIGVAAAGLLALAPVHLFNTASARDFVTGLCFDLASIYTYLRLLDEAPARLGWRSRLGYALSSLLALYTSYFFLIVLAAQGAYALTRRVTFKAWFSALGLLLLGFAPWAAYITAPTLQRLALYSTAQPSDAVSVSWLLTSSQVFRQLTVGQFSILPFGPVLAFYLALLGLGLYRVRRWREVHFHHRGFFVFGGLLSLAAALFLAHQWVLEVAPSRYLLVSLPFLIPLLTPALVFLWQQQKVFFGLTIVVLFLVSLSSLYAFTHRSPLPESDWNPQGLMTYLEEHLRPGDGLVFTSMEQAGYYLSWTQKRRPWHVFPLGMPHLERGTAQRVEQVLPTAAQRHQALWLILYRGATPAAQPILRWLEEMAYPAQSDWLTDSLVVGYVTAPEQTTVSGMARFGEIIVLLEAAYAPSPSPGGGMAVRLLWQAEQRPSQDYKVFVHLVDETGKRWTQHDAPPANGTRPTSRWRPGETVSDRHGLLLPSELPPGRYWLLVGLYHEAERLPAQSQEGQFPIDEGNAVKLGPVRILAP